MLALVNSLLPSEALHTLSRHAQVLPFHTQDITHHALSGHADLFFSPLPHTWVAAPNAPAAIVNQILSLGVSITTGLTPVSTLTPTLGAYNVAVAPSFAIANPHYLDPVLRTHLAPRTIIPTRQGMCRCNAICLGDAVLTSDPGIAQACLHHHIPHLLVDASPILLPGYRSGCLGGCCGISGSTLFLIGHLSHHPQGQLIQMFLKEHSIRLVQLYNGPLLDLGSILFAN